MTTFTRDPATINAEWNRLSGQSGDWSDQVARFQYFFALTDPAGLLMFWSNNRRTCSASIYADRNASGADRIAMINRGFRWVFLNTPVYVMSGSVAKDNAAMIAATAYINGIFLASEDAYSNTYKITLASLAKHYGPQAVIDELNANGRTGKANRLQAAWDAWKARQP